MILTYLEFFDHFTDGDDWEDLADIKAEAPEPLVCRSVGWVAAENKRMIKLVANLDCDPEADGRGFGVFCVLKADVIRRVELPIPKQEEAPK